MKIERHLIKDLVKWQNSPRRKPLIIQGVRQCGKTWLLENFGKQYFSNMIYFNFEKNQDLSSFFENSYDPQQILLNLSAYAGQKILPNETLIIFDEIQSCPRALNSLKYFCELTPEYVIASAGSLLGISLASQVGFPVGKVDFLELTPCTFKEYLHAVDPMLAEYTQSAPLSPIPEAFANRLSSYLREYLTFGGMPEAMSTFIETRDIEATEKVLDNIIIAYESDFAKHIPTSDIPKLSMIWNSIPAQFARETTRFIYGEVRKGARAKDLEDALQWLINASMVNKVELVECPELPLKAHLHRKSFKLYTTDVGILRKLASLSPAVLLNNQDIFADFKGRIVENFVAQQLYAMGIKPICYWTNPTGRAEVDFLIQDEDIIIPIEVKSGLNVTAKSLKTYREKYSPKISVRTSMLNLKLDDSLLNLPLYLIGEMPRILNIAKEQLHHTN